MTDDQKEVVASAILNSPKSTEFTKRTGAGRGKPVMPNINITDVSSMELTNFVGSDNSLMLF